jgi:hypothetical protein
MLQSDTQSKSAASKRLHSTLTINTSAPDPIESSDDEFLSASSQTPTPSDAYLTPSSSLELDDLNTELPDNDQKDTPESPVLKLRLIKQPGATL